MTDDTSAGSWPDPPITDLDLTQDIDLPPRHRLQSGPLADVLGERIDVEEFINGDWPHEYTPEKLARIVSYPMTVLEGTVLGFGDSSQVPAVLEAILRELVPGLSLVLKKDGSRRRRVFEKYGYVHELLKAPPHPLTLQPMAIEIFASPDEGGATRIHVATYSNMMCGGCRVSYQ